MDSGEATEFELSELSENFLEFIVHQETAALGESLDLDGVDLSAILNNL